MLIKLLRSVREYPQTYTYALGMGLMAAALLYPLLIETTYTMHRNSGADPNAASSLPLTYMHRLLRFSAYSTVQACFAVGGPLLSLLAVWWSIRSRARPGEPQLLFSPGGEPPPSVTPPWPACPAPVSDNRPGSAPDDSTRTGHRFPLQLNSEFLARRRQSNRQSNQLYDDPPARGLDS